MQPIEAMELKIETNFTEFTSMAIGDKNDSPILCPVFAKI